MIEIQPSCCLCGRLRSCWAPLLFDRATTLFSAQVLHIALCASVLEACHPSTLVPALRLQGQMRVSGAVSAQRVATRVSAVLVFGSAATRMSLVYPSMWTVADEETLAAACNQNPLCVQETAARGSVVVGAVQ